MQRFVKGMLRLEMSGHQKRRNKYCVNKTHNVNRLWQEDVTRKIFVIGNYELHNIPSDVSWKGSCAPKCQATKSDVINIASTKRTMSTALSREMLREKSSLQETTNSITFQVTSPEREVAPRSFSLLAGACLMVGVPPPAIRKKEAGYASKAIVGKLRHTMHITLVFPTFFSQNPHTTWSLFCCLVYCIFN